MVERKLLVPSSTLKVPRDKVRKPKVTRTRAEWIDWSIQQTIATRFTDLTASVLASTFREDYPEVSKDEALAFVERNLNEYNKLVLESLGDAL